MSRNSEHPLLGVAFQHELLIKKLGLQNIMLNLGEAEREARS